MIKFRNFTNFSFFAILLFLGSGSISTFAQVSGISYTISPAGEYTMWDDKAGLEDGLLVGGKLGIGFGEFIELRGIYMRSLNQKTDFSNYGLSNFDEDAFIAREVTITRYGAELRTNFGSKKLAPYLTLGSGIQSLEADSLAENETIYISAGLGIKFKLGDRFTFNVEAKNTPYNFSSARNFLTEEEKESFGLSFDDFSNQQLRKNWSLNASFQIYIGGRKPGSLTELDKAYMSTFSGGLRGLRVPVEPSLARVNFNDDLGYRDTWMVGGYAGMDFNQYVGIRAFYFRAMQEDKITTDLDDMNMYGGELRLKLNAARGLTPYVILGGGFIDVKNKYVPNSFRVAEDQGFASGGVGLTIPLSKRFNIFGSARALLTTGGAVEDLQVVDEIKRSFMYGAGLRFIIGKKANAQTVLKTNIDNEVGAALAIQQKKNEEKSKELTAKYENRITDLETELNAAYEAEDVEKAAALMAEKEQNEAVVAELKSREADQKKSFEETLASKEANLDSLKKGYEQEVVRLEEELNRAYDNRDLEAATSLLEEKEATQKNLEQVKTAKQSQGNQTNMTNIPAAGGVSATSQGQGISIVPSTSRLQMTPAEFENLIEEILENMAMPTTGNLYPTAYDVQGMPLRNANSSKEQADLNKRIENIEKLLLQMNESKENVSVVEEEETQINSSREMMEYSAKILLEIQKLNAKVDANNEEIQKLKGE